MGFARKYVTWKSGKFCLVDEKGAVTVDWVVLTAALAGLAIGVATMLQGGATESSGALGNRLTNYEISTEF